MHVDEGKAQGLKISYELLDFDLLPGGAEKLPALLEQAEQRGFSGLNITYPSKQAVIPLLDQIAQGDGATASANPPAAGATLGAGNSAQDALLSLIKADGTSNSSAASGTATSGTATASSVGGLSQADLARAFALYQSQLEQQLVSSIGATQSAGIA